MRPCERFKTVRHVLEYVRELLLHDGWCRGAQEDALGRRCLVGTVWAAERFAVLPEPGKMGPGLEAYLLLKKMSGSDSLMVWNDTRRGFDEVLTMLEMAIEET